MGIFLCAKFGRDQPRDVGTGASKNSKIDYICVVVYGYI